MSQRNLFAKFRPVTMFLSVRVFAIVVGQILIYAANGWMSKAQAFQDYFYLYWISYAIESLLLIAIASDLFQAATRHEPQLQRLGAAVLWGVAAAGMAYAVWTSFRISVEPSPAKRIVVAVSQFQPIQSWLVLATVVVTLIGARMLGRALRLPALGVSLGLIVLSLAVLLIPLFQRHTHSISISTTMSAASAVVAFCIWAAFFALSRPEPA